MGIRKLLAAGLVAAAFGSAHAGFDWFGGRLSIGGAYGRTDPQGPDSFEQDYDAGRIWSGHLKYFLNDTVSLQASFADLFFDASGPMDSSVRLQPIVGSIRANLFKGLPITPYLIVGAGESINKVNLPGGGVEKWEKPVYQGGVGLEFFINKDVSIGAEGLWHHFRNTGEGDPLEALSLLGTVNMYFGRDPKTAKLRAKADTAEQRAAEASAQATTANAQAAAANQSAIAAQQQTDLAAQQAAQATAAAAAADAARADAERRSQELQLQSRQAQAELDEMKALVERKELKPIAFATGSSRLLSSSNDQLDRVAAITKRYPKLKLRVEGHTDDVGSAASNQKLSEARAEAVRRYLAENGGLSQDQVSAVGFGETRPMASNASADGRAQNRRVEFFLLLP